MAGTICKLGYAIAAVNIDDHVVHRCLRHISRACVHDGVTYHTCVVAHVTGVSIRSEARNRAIAQLIKANCDIITCVDVDCIVPPGLPQHTVKTVRRGTALIHLVRDVDREPETDEDLSAYLRLPQRVTGLGGYVSLAATDWLRVGGWDERCVGWGGEDNVLHSRLKSARVRIVISAMFPLLHVRHVKRDDRRRHKLNLLYSHIDQPNFLARYLEP